MNKNNTLSAKAQAITFTDSDIVNIEDFIPGGEGNYYNVHPILVHDHGFTVGVVFAEHLQDALDILADKGRLDSFKIDTSSPAEVAEYKPDSDNPTCTFLGNCGDPYDIETLGAIDLETPPMSFVALYNAAHS